MSSGRSVDISRKPLLEAEWLEDKNGSLLGDFASGSIEKAWWLCPVGHKYSRTIVSRYTGGDCSYCANDRVLAGFNDLESQAPEVASEWADSNSVASSEVLFTSKKTYDWKCILGHTWTDTVATRTVFGRNCQFCEDKKVWTGFNDLKTHWPAAEHFWSAKNGQALDEILWNSRAQAEWECSLGHFWTSKIYIMLRDKSCPFCEDLEPWPGFNTIDVTFPQLMQEFVSNNKGETDPRKVLGRSSRVPMVWRCPKGHEERQAPAAFRARFGCSFCLRENDKFTWPTIEEDTRLRGSWDADANSHIDPSEISAMSEKKYFWKCKKGHTWETSAYLRFKRLSECPYCEGKAIWPGFNDLQKLFPELAEEWSSANSIPPNKVSPGNNNLFKWKCYLGHSWDASPSNRTRGRNGGTNCPTCTNRRVEKGFNDLTTTHPALAREWNWELNEELTPEEVLFKRKDPCWWECTLGHSWSCPPRSRYRGDTLMSCPFCGLQKLLKGFNDLKTRRPDLMAWWSFTKNDVLPEDVIGGGRSSFWWTCPNGHDFESQIVARAQSKNNCPECAPPISNTTAGMLELNRDKLYLEWDSERNRVSLDHALDFMRSEKLNWKCAENGHSFTQRLMKRIWGHNCPYCSGKSVLKGFNDLMTVNPQVAASWDYKANGKERPESYTQLSGKRFWWVCEEGHPSWKTSIAHRTGGRNCPGCKETGFNPSEPGYLYWLRHDSWLKFKIGISNVPQQRIGQHKLNGWTALDVVGPMDGYYVQDLEADLLAVVRRRTETLGELTSHGKFDGFTECWSSQDFVIDGISQLRQLLFSDELEMKSES